MSSIIPFLGFAALVTANHGLFLVLAKRRMQLDRIRRERFWNQHLLLNGILWLMVFLWVFLLGFQLPHQETTLLARALGWLLIFGGGVMIVWTRLLLGRDQAMGVRFFLPERARRIESSLYRYLHNPMYDGFILLLIGVGLAFGIVEYFVIAGASFFLLNILLARVENFKSSFNPF